MWESCHWCPDLIKGGCISVSVEQKGPTYEVPKVLHSNSSDWHAGRGTGERAVEAPASEVAKLTASDASASDRFGISVAVSGDTAVVGAPFDGSGSAYVFVGSAGSWIQQATRLWRRWNRLRQPPWGGPRPGSHDRPLRWEHRHSQVILGRGIDCEGPAVACWLM